MPTLTEEQNLAIDSINEHILVSAGAGSGKTFVLVERYIEILRQFTEASVSEIIAVTFTRKAAEEMRSRLKSRLKQIVETCPQEEKERWTKHLSEIDGARIGTIHSLCESILKTFPAEAKIDPGFELLDDLERAEILEESINVAIHHLLEHPSSDSLELLDYPVETIKGWLADFLKSPLKYKEASRLFGDASRDNIRAYAKSFVEETLRKAVNFFPDKQEYKSHANYILQNIWPDATNSLALKQNEFIPLIQVSLNQNEASIRERWQAISELAALDMKIGQAGGATGKTLRESLKRSRDYAKEFRKNLEADLNSSDEKSFGVLSALLNLTNFALQKYEQSKQAKQKLDFDDLIDKTSTLLLNADSSARKHLSKNLLGILVDEFQDTNWTQAKLLSSLAFLDGKLFLIGDDKQSIYKFQGADVAVFNTYKNLISSLSNQENAFELNTNSHTLNMPKLEGNGQLLSLSMSFRSHPQIVDFVNYLFHKLLNNEQAGSLFQAQFNHLHASRQNTAEAARIEILSYQNEEESEESGEKNLDSNRYEAELIAKWIIEKVQSETSLFDKQLDKERPIQYGDFAVLLQANADFAAVEWALNQANIPYVSYAGSGYLERQEVYDLENLLKWLLCKQDSHALLAVLRSPIFGFSDDLIHSLKGGQPGSLWFALRQKLTNNPSPQIRRTYALLNELSQQSHKLSLGNLVQTILLKTNYDMILLSMPGGKQRSRNVFKFLSLAAKHNYMSLAEFLHSLQAMRDLKVKNLTDAPLNADNSVKIMTIHGSKGLEFGAVALARLSKKIHSYSSKLLFSKDFGIALDVTRDKDEEKPAFYLATNQLSKEMEEAEKKRLLYVALTRARDYLGLFYEQGKSTQDSFSGWLDSTMQISSQNTVDSAIVNLSENKFSARYLLRQASELQLNNSQKNEEKNSVAEQIELNPISKMSLSLLDIPIAQEESIAQTTPWQALLRVSPTKNNSEITIHPTILGSYFHLLLSQFTRSFNKLPEHKFVELCFHNEIGIWHPVLQKKLISEGLRLLDIFYESPLQDLMQKAKRRIHETPYTMFREGKVQAEARPDLIVEDAQGNFHIIDYKTDHFELSAIAEQSKLHKDQLTNYINDFEALSGCKAKPWLYFAQFGILHPLTLNTPEQLKLKL